MKFLDAYRNNLFLYPQEENGKCIEAIEEVFDKEAALLISAKDEFKIAYAVLRSIYPVKELDKRVEEEISTAALQILFYFGEVNRNKIKISYNRVDEFFQNHKKTSDISKKFFDYIKQYPLPEALPNFNTFRFWSELLLKDKSCYIKKLFHYYYNDCVKEEPKSDILDRLIIEKECVFNILKRFAKDEKFSSAYSALEEKREELALEDKDRIENCIDNVLSYKILPDACAILLQYLPSFRRAGNEGDDLSVMAILDTIDVEKDRKEGDSTLPSISIYEKINKDYDSAIGDRIKKGCYLLTKLPEGDSKAYVLGYETFCCQSIGGVGASCTIDGILSKKSGFYVLLKGDGSQKNPKDFFGEKKNIKYDKCTIVGQGYAWISDKGNLVFDSWESKSKDYDGITTLLLKELCTQITEGTDTQNTVIKKVTIGASGKTPNCFKSAISLENDLLEKYDFGSSTIIKTRNITQYSDAEQKQYVLYDTEFPSSAGKEESFIKKPFFSYNFTDEKELKNVKGAILDEIIKNNITTINDDYVKNYISKKIETFNDLTYEGKKCAIDLLFSNEVLNILKNHKEAVDKRGKDEIIREEQYHYIEQTLEIIKSNETIEDFRDIVARVETLDPAYDKKYICQFNLNQLEELSHEKINMFLPIVTKEKITATHQIFFLKALFEYCKNEEKMLKMLKTWDKKTLEILSRPDVQALTTYCESAIFSKNDEAIVNFGKIAENFFAVNKVIKPKVFITLIEKDSNNLNDLVPLFSYNALMLIQKEEATFDNLKNLLESGNNLLQCIVKKSCVEAILYKKDLGYSFKLLSELNSSSKIDILTCKKFIEFLEKYGKLVTGLSVKGFAKLEDKQIIMYINAADEVLKKYIKDVREFFKYHTNKESSIESVQKEEEALLVSEEKTAKIIASVVHNKAVKNELNISFSKKISKPLSFTEKEKRSKSQSTMTERKL